MPNRLRLWGTRVLAACGCIAATHCASASHSGVRDAGPGVGGAGDAATSGGTGNHGGSGSSVAGAGGTVGRGGAGGSVDDGGPADAGGGSSGSVAPIYAHTDTSLFQIDPTDSTLTPAAIGDFDCLGDGGDTAMADLAVDKSGTLWAVSARNVYQLTLQAAVVHCASTTPLKGTQRLYGLSFAPAGVLDATKEVLIGANTAGELWSIAADGSMVLHGNFGTVPANDGHGHTYAAGSVGKLWELSGDIVLVDNAGAPKGFAIVRDCPNPPSTTGCNTTDTLIELDPAKLATSTTQSVTKAVRGQIVKGTACADASSTAYGGFSGVAVAGPDVLGFTRRGGIVRVSNVDASGCLVKSVAGSQWAGAAVTTSMTVAVP